MHIHHDWTMQGYLKSLALGLLLLFARMPDLSAEGVPTNEIPAQILKIIHDGYELNLGHDGLVAFYCEKFSAMGAEGVELLIGELKKPRRKPLPSGLAMHATFVGTACEVYARLGQDAYNRLSEELKKDSSPVFWENACYVYARSDNDDTFEVLAGWVIENGAEATDKSRVSAEAYSRLHNKLLRNHLPTPSFARLENDLPARFEQWWQSNRQTVVQQYLEQKKARSEAAKVPDM